MAVVERRNFCLGDFIFRFAQTCLYPAQFCLAFAHLLSQDRQGRGGRHPDRGQEPVPFALQSLDLPAQPYGFRADLGGVRHHLSCLLQNTAQTPRGFGKNRGLDEYGLMHFVCRDLSRSAAGKIPLLHALVVRVDGACAAFGPVRGHTPATAATDAPGQVVAIVAAVLREPGRAGLRFLQRVLHRLPQTLVDKWHVRRFVDVITPRGNAAILAAGEEPVDAVKAPILLCDGHQVPTDIGPRVAVGCPAHRFPVNLGIGFVGD